MTFKTEKGQLAYQWLWGLTICVWVWFLLFTVGSAWLPAMSSGSGFLSFTPGSIAFLTALLLTPALTTALAILRVIKRIVRLRRGSVAYKKRNAVLLTVECVALLASLFAGLLHIIDGLNGLGLLLSAMAVCILAGLACLGRFVKEEKPVFTVKLYKKKLLLLSLAVLLLLPAFIPVSYSDRMVYQNDVGCTGRHYHAIAYSLVVRTKNDKAVDFNIAIFPFNYQKKVYVHLDEFD